MPKKIFFSIVIPTLNEEKFLPKLLNDLSKQTFKNFEVIHVDGNSEDKTVAEAKKLRKDLNLKIHSVKKRNVSFQRNFGAKKAKANWIVFMDADNNLPSFFLQELKFQLKKNSDTKIFTCWANPKNYTAKNRPIILGTNIFIELSSKIDPFALGALIGIKKNLFKEVQFDENIHFGEDSVFVKIAFEKGYPLKCFREPTYSYSLRRLEKEGLIKISRTVAQSFLDFLSGKNYGASINYPMKGGSYYQQKNRKFLARVEKFVKKASKKQLAQAKRIFNYLKDL